jgi:hypothetical protein
VRMEGGAIVTRTELREVLDRALTTASDFCDDLAPPDYMGHLFVDSHDVPIEADERTVVAGSARALPLIDFASLPELNG